MYPKMKCFGAPYLPALLDRDYHVAVLYIPSPLADKRTVKFPRFLGYLSTLKLGISTKRICHKYFLSKYCTVHAVTTYTKEEDQNIFLE